MRQDKKVGELMGYTGIYLIQPYTAGRWQIFLLQKSDEEPKTFDSFDLARVNACAKTHWAVVIDQAGLFFAVNWDGRLIWEPDLKTAFRDVKDRIRRRKEDVRAQGAPLIQQIDRLSNTPSKPRPVKCIETGRVYKTLADASRALGKHVSYAWSAMRAKHPENYEYHFEYVEEAKA